MVNNDKYFQFNFQEYTHHYIRFSISMGCKRSIYHCTTLIVSDIVFRRLRRKYRERNKIITFVKQFRYV